MRIDVHHHSEGYEFEQMFTMLRVITLKLEAIMASIDDLLSAASAESTVDDSIIALLTSIKSQLDTALAGGLTPANQAKIDQVFATLQANAAKVGAAVTANTPAAPTP